MFNSTANVGANGIRMGVISMQSIHPDVAHDLWYGPHAVDLSYQAAYNEAKAQAESEWDQHYDEAEIAAAETDHHMSDKEREQFIESWLNKRDVSFDREEFVEQKLEWFSDCHMCDEPDIEGEYEGVKYLIGWLGGAPILWVYESQFLTKADLCSPCVPNAGSLDSVNPDGYECYDVPPEWRFKEN